MNLQPGTSLSPEELNNIGCIKRWNSIQKSYSDFTGKKRTKMPDYNMLNNQNQNSQNNTVRNVVVTGGKNKTAKLRKHK